MSGDWQGDPLPARALARIGSARLRHDGQITAIAFLDADRVVSVGQDERLRIWNAHDGRMLRDVATDAVLCVSVAPRGAFIAASGDTRVQLFDPTTLELVRVWEAALAPVSSLALEHAQLAVGAFDGSVAIWNLDGEEISRPIDGGPVPLALRWARAGVLVVTRDDGTVLCIDVARATTHTLAELPEARPLLALEIATDAHQVLVGGYSPALWTVDLDGGAASPPFLHGAGERAHSLAVSSDGTRLAVGGSAVTLLSPDAIAAVRTLPLSTGGGSRVAMSPDGRVLAVGASTGRISLWDAHTAVRAACSRGPDDDVLCVAFSPDGTQIAAGGLDGAIVVASSRDGTPLRTLTGHGTSRHVRTLAFVSDGVLASGGDDGTFRLWDLSTGVETLRVATAPVRSMALARDGRIAFVGGEQGELHRISLPDGRIETVTAHKQAVTAVLLEPGGAMVITGSRDRALRFWDSTTLDERRKVNATAAVAALSPDGRTLATVGFGEPVRLWDTANWLERRVIPALSVQALAFSPDGTQLATAGGDAVVRIWDVARRELITSLEGHTGREVRAVAYAPDGARLASGGSDMSVLVWDPKPQGALS